MAKEERMKNYDSMRELSLDELDDVAGGKISAAGYVLLFAAIQQFKALGRDREYAINAIISGWNKGCKFKTYATDGTDMDLQEAIQFVRNFW